ncbi:SusC/RagA family TonB-linked outer membrane protein [Parapedobacter soli]|uniref:SusC/RagA family TonB-linked outer membrane protein n=1 Tax=Parapedobacter soli TaxID=416955 RepID=UPI0021C9CFAC|nr:TonB-dependent receptor [Parapedobacter soli]
MKPKNCLSGLGSIIWGLLLVCLGQPLLAEDTPSQDRVINGSVTNVAGEPLAGATVAVKDQTISGTSTNQEGRYSLSVPDGAVLVFSMMGYESQELAVGDKLVLDVTLLATSQQVDEVTVVAFGKQKKGSIVSAITTIRPEELRIPSSNLTTTLAGRLAGLISYQQSGAPGDDNARFFIRGITTFGSGVPDPLILIDNVELTSRDLANLNPDDIASFSILKDATATALYGAKAANGIVLVTTKEGRESKLNINVRHERSVSSPTRKFEMSDPVTFMELNNEAVATRDPLMHRPYTLEKIDKTRSGANPYVYPSVNWLKLMTKDQALNDRTSINLSGGGKIATYYIAGTMTNDQGILNVPKSNGFDNNISLKKYGIRSNINVNLTPTTLAKIKVSAQFDNYRGPIPSGDDVYKSSLNANGALFPAIYEPDVAFSSANHILFGNVGNDAPQYYNPYADLLRGYRDSRSSTVLAILELTQKLDVVTPGLDFRFLINSSTKSDFSITRSYNPLYYEVNLYNRQLDQYSLREINPASGRQTLDLEGTWTDARNLVYMEGALNYNRVLNSKHALGGVLVYTQKEELSGSATDFQSSLPFRNVGLAGRFTYGFAERYNLNLSFGYNGSERFSNRHRYGFFPSAGIGWNVSNEKFWEKSKISNVVTKLMLRGSYGIVGNDRIGDETERFFYLSDVSLNGSSAGRFGTNFIESTPTTRINRYSNDEITWEKAYKSDAGIEIGLFHNIDIRLDLYHQKRTDILMPRADIPTTMGLTYTPKSNVGIASNKGFDLSTDYNFVANDRFWATVRANLTYSTSKYLNYEEPNYPDAPWLSHKGQPIGMQLGYVAERLFVDDLEVRNSPTQMFPGLPVKGGDIKYVDLNKDGVINFYDQTFIGFPTTPEIIYGFGGSFGYRNFDVSFFFQGSARSSFWIDYNAMSPFKEETIEGARGNTALSQFIADDHWSEDNRNLYATWPRLAATTNLVGSNNGQLNTWFLRNGGFLRLKSAELGYTIPERLIPWKTRVYCSGLNLLTFSTFKLWDVEMGGNALNYPIQRVINFGININI